MGPREQQTYSGGETDPSASLGSGFYIGFYIGFYRKILILILIRIL